MTVRLNETNTPRGRVASYVWGPDVGSGYGVYAGHQKAGGVGGLCLVLDGVATATQYPWQPGYTNEDPTDDDYFSLMDRMGNVTGYRKAATTEAADSLSAVYEYDAFGQEIRSVGPASDKQPYRFSTKYTEGSTGLVYYGYRWYDAGKGRWINRDPIEENGGVNLYGMVGNDGVNSIDVLGLANQLEYDDHHWAMKLRSKKLGKAVGQAEVNKLCSPGYFNIDRYVTGIEDKAHDFVHGRFQYLKHYKALLTKCKGLIGNKNGKSPCCCFLSGLKKLIVETILALNWQKSKRNITPRVLDPNYPPMHKYDEDPPGTDTGPEFDQKLAQACSTCNTDNGGPDGEAEVLRSVNTLDVTVRLNDTQRALLPAGLMPVGEIGRRLSPVPLPAGRVPAPAPSPAPPPFSPGLVPAR